MDYWADVSQPDRAVLTIGDIGGQVTHWRGGGGGGGVVSGVCAIRPWP